jgi:4-hydroxybenzoyl-CoA thioesterase
MKFPFELPTTIRFSHCDPAGIVFFPQYLVMFNGLVEDWVTQGLGIRYADLLAVRRIGMPTVKLQCEFTAVSRMGDEVMLGLAVERIGGSSLHVALGCRLGDEVRVRVKQVLVTTSLQTHRPIPIPDDLRDAMTRFQADAQASPASSAAST